MAQAIADRAARSYLTIAARWDRMDPRDRDVIARAAGLGLGRYGLLWRELREAEQRAIERGAVRCARLARELLDP